MPLGCDRMVRLSGAAARLSAEVGGAGRATEAASVNYAAFLSSAAACASNSAA
jgi:hypothetical protein